MEKSYDPLSSETDGQTLGAVCSYKGSLRAISKKEVVVMVLGPTTNFGKKHHFLFLLLFGPETFRTCKITINL